MALIVYKVFEACYVGSFKKVRYAIQKHFTNNVTKDNPTKNSHKSPMKFAGVSLFLLLL